MKYEKVLKGWERQHNGLGATEKGNTSSPDGLRFYIVLEGEFEYQTANKDDMRTKRTGATAGKNEFDVRKLLFARKKATIDDRRRMIVSEERRQKMS